MSEEMILYDLACRGERNRCWSWNVWKIRMVLNHKGLQYRTIWLTHPEIEPTLKALGIPPNDDKDKGSPYTVPTIRLPSGEHFMESSTILRKLEELYPQPPLHLDVTPIPQTGAAIGAAVAPLRPVFMPRIGRSVIKESSINWFREGKEKAFGMSLEDFESTKGGEQAWKAAEANSGLLKDVLTRYKRDEGPFVLGSQVSYADFMVVAILENFRRIGEDLFERICGWDGKIGALYEGCRPWLERDE